MTFRQLKSTGSTSALQHERAAVHGDFSKRNVLVAEVDGRWTVTAIIDWESTFSGRALADIACFLRYETVRRATAEPAFSRGYTDGGGRLEPDWRALARAVDLLPLTRILEGEHVPVDVVAEVVELVRANIEERDPDLQDSRQAAA